MDADGTGAVRYRCAADGTGRCDRGAAVAGRARGARAARRRRRAEPVVGQEEYDAKASGSAPSTARSIAEPTDVERHRPTPTPRWRPSTGPSIPRVRAIVQSLDRSASRPSRPTGTTTAVHEAFAGAAARSRTTPSRASTTPRRSEARRRLDDGPPQLGSCELDAATVPAEVPLLTRVTDGQTRIARRLGGPGDSPPPPSPRSPLGVVLVVVVAGVLVVAGSGDDGATTDRPAAIRSRDVSREQRGARRRPARARSAQRRPERAPRSSSPTRSSTSLDDRSSRSAALEPPPAPRSHGVARPSCDAVVDAIEADPADRRRRADPFAAVDARWSTSGWPACAIGARLPSTHDEPSSPSPSCCRSTTTTRARRGGCSPPTASRTFEAAGRRFLQVEPEVLTAAHPRGDPRHQPPAAPRPPRSSCATSSTTPRRRANDRFVALDLLKNACIAAGGVLPMCQDTGTAIVMGKKGELVLTGGGDEERHRPRRLRRLHRRSTCATRRWRRSRRGTR